MTAPSNDELKTIDELKTLLLDHYHCTFFLPLLGFGKGLDETKLEPIAALKKTYPLDKELSEADAEAFYYFTPTLRDIVFDRGVPNESGLQAVEEWHLSPDILKDWRLELLPSKEQKEHAGGDVLKLALVHQKVEFQSVSLYRYFNGIYMLAFTVRPHATQHMYLEAWLRFTRLGRQLYPTFTEQWNEKKIAPLHLFTTTESKTPTRVALNDKVSYCIPKSSEHLSPILIYLTEQFFAEDIHEQLQDEIRLFDDRMFVSVAYGLAGDKHNEEIRKRVKALIATTDRFEDTDPDMNGYTYTQTAIDRIIQNTEFDFWADKGGHFIYNDMVNGYLYRDWFFNNIIAPKHIPYIYDRMLIQALFYQASLRHYDHEITVTTKALLNNKDKVNDISKQRGQFIEFTNQYWFREVTNQMQGKEIFRLQQQGLGLQEHYTLLQDEITRTDEYLQALETDNAGKRAHQFTKLAAVLAMVAALPIFNDIFKTEDSLWQSIADSLANTGYLSVFCAKVSLAVLLASLLLITAFYFWRKKD